MGAESITDQGAQNQPKGLPELLELSRSTRKNPGFVTLSCVGDHRYQLNPGGGEGCNANVGTESMALLLHGLTLSPHEGFSDLSASYQASNAPCWQRVFRLQSGQLLDDPITLIFRCISVADGEGLGVGPRPYLFKRSGVVRAALKLLK